MVRLHVDRLFTCNHTDRCHHTPRRYLTHILVLPQEEHAEEQTGGYGPQEVQHGPQEGEQADFRDVTAVLAFPWCSAGGGEMCSALLGLVRCWTKDITVVTANYVGNVSCNMCVCVFFYRASSFWLRTSSSRTPVMTSPSSFTKGRVLIRQP